MIALKPQLFPKGTFEQLSFQNVVSLRFYDFAYSNKNANQYIVFCVST